MRPPTEEEIVMTDGLKEVIPQKSGEETKRGADGDGARCCSPSCCATAEAEKADPIT
jgi:hypothetical protein